MFTPLHEKERTFGTVYALLQFLVLPQLFAYGNSWLHLPSWLVTVCLSGLNGICAGLIYRRFFLSSCKDAAKAPGKLLIWTAIGLVCYLGANALYLCLLQAVYPAFTNLNDANVASSILDGGIWTVLIVVVAAPIAEETIFRGLLFRGVYDRSPLTAWLLSVGLFALIHVLGYVGTYNAVALLLAFFQYLPAGVCLALSYRMSGTFLCPVLIHSVINLIGVFTII